MYRKSFGEQIAQIFIHIILFAFSFCCIYPFILTLMASISSEQAITRNGYRLIPEEFSSLAYETVFKDSSIYSGYAVSIFVTVVGTCMALVLCGMAGYAMSLQRVKYRNTISMYFYIPMVFNAGLLPRCV